MANIVINEISQNYTYNIGTTSFATVALPITASWGPAYLDTATLGIEEAQMLEETTWRRFPATQSGLETFVATYRGPAANYRLADDYSYAMAMTLLTAGYDVLVCRVCPGTFAQGTFTTSDSKSFGIKAKYPGTFGNTLQVTLTAIPNTNFWNAITYVVDATGVRTAVENLIFTFKPEAATDDVLYISEVESQFLTFIITDTLTNVSAFTQTTITLAGGTDKASESNMTAAQLITAALALATQRYTDAGYTATQCSYIQALQAIDSDTIDIAKASIIRYNEWKYNAAIKVYDLLKDKLSYNHNRVVSPGWDDQNITAITGEMVDSLAQISPMHLKLMDSAFYSRCATALLDIPKSLNRVGVYNNDTTHAGYAQLLSRYVPTTASIDISGSLYQTHSALFAPWGQYKFIGTNKQNDASPSFQALMLQRDMILNQTLQYEWALPTNRKTNLRLGKLAYTIPKRILDQWQGPDGVGVNAITTIPDLGTTLWGNSTLYELPPASWQALADLSTRYLVNAIEDVVYRCGIAITFHYNNQQAYSDFYAGVTPILDTMRNVGAIDDYAVQMSADIDALGTVRARSIIGKIFLKLNGVINDIKIDLVALPPSADLNAFTQ